MNEREEGFYFLTHEQQYKEVLSKERIYSDEEPESYPVFAYVSYVPQPYDHPEYRLKYLYPEELQEMYDTYMSYRRQD